MSNTPLPNMPTNPPAPPRGGQFDFMLKDPQAPPKKFGIPTNLSKPALVLLILIPVVVLALVAGLLFGGKGPNNFAQILDLAAQSQEITRVSNAYQKNLANAADQNIAATASSSLSSQQSQFVSYLSKNKYKYKPTALKSHLDKNTDASLNDAIRNNRLDSTYLAYLNSALQKYQSSMNTTFKISGKNFQKVLSNAYSSNKVLLQSPQFALNQ